MSRPLKECPNCSREPIIQDLPMGQAIYKCLVCGLRGPVGSYHDDAAVMWNQMVTHIEHLTLNTNTGFVESDD